MEVATKVITILCCCLASCLVTGCGPNSAAQRPSTPVSPVLPTLGFAPARIAVTPWTEIKGPVAREVAERFPKIGSMATMIV